MRLILRILGGAITAVMVVALVGTVFLSLAAKRTRDPHPSVLGHKVLSVVSGSMEPAIKTGDVIIVQPLATGQQVGEGDVITFRTKEKADMLITHRVVGIISVNGEPSAYVTKGDANDTVDMAPVAQSQIVGVYRWRIPYYGYFSNFMRSTPGIILMVVLPGLALIGMEIRKIVQAVQEEEDAKKQQSDPADA